MHFEHTFTVIVPTRNEEATIESVVTSLKKFTENIVVIDGKSTDATRERAAAAGAKVILQKTRGKGAALRQAIDEIDTGIIVFMDADGSHEAADVLKIVQPVINNEADMVVASRFLGGSDELHGSWHNFVRMVGSSLITLAINYRWNVHLTDVENGFRAITRAAALALNLKACDFTIEQEMVMKALKKGYRVREIASHEYERKGGVSKLPTSQGWKFILKFLKDFW